MTKPYHLDWVTNHIAVGGAPLSYDQLDEIRTQGVDAIINLCAEYCDLHDIESGHGFEVYYLPIPDEATPDREDLNKAMAWMDVVIGRNRRILIHCRLGIGRTGTLLYAYLRSRNLLEQVEKGLLARIRSRPASFYQWRLIRTYSTVDGARKRNPFCVELLRELLEKLRAWVRKFVQGAG